MRLDYRAALVQARAVMMLGQAEFPTPVLSWSPAHTKRAAAAGQPKPKAAQTPAERRQAVEHLVAALDWRQATAARWHAHNQHPPPRFAMGGAGPNTDGDQARRRRRRGRAAAAEALGDRRRRRRRLP
jgi:hypothetical protein